uniref:Methyltransferase domain-containing protein n=1 Tax=Chrysotila carterae TaxID=13221 RepID=A0A7S4B9F4_CHRCT
MALHLRVERLSLGLQEQEDEPMVAFNTAHYNGGLNARFEAEDAISFFAGGDEGGGGMFEDPEKRDIAGATEKLMDVFRKHGLVDGCTLLDVGAGTGLMLGHLSRAVGESGKVLAIDVSQRFVGFMEQRVKRNKLPNVRVSKCSPKSADLADYAGKVDLAIIIDVYHHFEYPRTFMRSLHTVLRDGGRVVVCDFHRDPAKMVHHKPEWAIEHIRADQQTFRQEIESAGFELVDSAEVQELVENYVMVFQSSSK